MEYNLYIKITGIPDSTVILSILDKKIEAHTDDVIKLQIPINRVTYLNVEPKQRGFIYGIFDKFQRYTKEIKIHDEKTVIEANVNIDKVISIGLEERM